MTVCNQVAIGMLVECALDYTFISWEQVFIYERGLF